MISPTLDVYDPIIKKWPFIRDEGKEKDMHIGKLLRARNVPIPMYRTIYLSIGMLIWRRVAPRA